VRDDREFERAVAAFARAPNGGVIVAAGPAANVRRERINALMVPPPTARCLLHSATTSKAAASSPTGRISSASTGQRRATSTASSGVISRPSCRSRRRPNTSW
jgi:hypothetical protein